MTDTESYHDRIESAVERYRADRDAFDPPDDPPAPDRAMAYCREGLGPTVMIYVDARANDWGVRFSEREFDLLHEAVNGYLSLYTACYGVETEPDATVREAAELLLDTHNIRDVAAMLTGVPERGTVDD
ncbi:hypothetical protein [Halorientalis regularis]|jgi:hypothetical protein|uniref:DUF8055 domain-containing protein n=1 Tax=Halorientalis regularis TaxID=660518 RepID=A0A1G7N0S4_9EURY|nr:hypothetical protein [Halorientalis regularis]SDF67624.1 hypothetical protein SAMN05216218_108140 [Halorientalis regularis]